MKINKMVVRQSYLHNGNSFTSKMVCFCMIHVTTKDISHRITDNTKASAKVTLTLGSDLDLGYWPYWPCSVPVASSEPGPEADRFHDPFSGLCSQVCDWNEKGKTMENHRTINSLAPGRWGSNFKIIILKFLSCEFHRNHYQVSIGSGDDSVPSGNKPLSQPMLTKIYVTIWCPWATTS